MDTQVEPTTPGFYRYANGEASKVSPMIFLLDHVGQWWSITDWASMEKCVWGYIEQALSVFTLERV